MTTDQVFIKFTGLWIPETSQILIVHLLYVLKSNQIVGRQSVFTE